MRVTGLCFAMRKYRFLARRLVVVTCALALCMFTIAVTGAVARAAVSSPGGGHPASKHTPGLVHPRAVPQRAGGTSTVRGPAKAVAGPAAVAPAPRYSATQRADLAARAQAKATGKPAVVPSQTTDTTEVLAQPNGEFELISNTLPVRVHVNGTWQPVSTRLRQAADGSWSAPLTSAPVTFSGGGNGPLVTVTDPTTGKTVSVTWPYTLPKPTVSGDTAVYGSVFPGVDLHLQATSTGYSEVLVVRNAVAAADPRLRSLAFTLQGGSGVTIENAANGTSSAVDTATGKTLFNSGQPEMWDSAVGRPLGGAPSAAGSGDGRVFAVPTSHRLGTSAGHAAEALTLTPFAAAAVPGGKITYPLYIDPQINISSAEYYSEVASYGVAWNSTTGTTSVGKPTVEEGDCGYSDCYWDANGSSGYGYVVRDYFNMDTSALATRGGQAATVDSATFSADEVQNSDGCTAQPVALYSSGYVDSSTKWGGPQESELSSASSNAGGSPSCAENAGYVDLGATSWLQSAANNSWSSATFELRAVDESSEYSYKLFTDNPTLTVWYDFAPLTPAVNSVDDEVTCTSTTYTSDATPAVTATGKDNNPSPLNLDYTYNLDTSAGASVKEATVDNGGGGYASGTAVTWTAPALTSGDAYEVDVQTKNVLTSGDKATARTSPWSPEFDFTVLSTPPAAGPAISSFDYPSAQWGQSQGAPGVFTVGTNGDAHIAGFSYYFDSQSVAAPKTTDCSYADDGGIGTSQTSTGTGNTDGELAVGQDGSAQILAPSTLAPGRHTLYVMAFDDAHNASPVVAYPFYVAPDYQSATQPVTYVDGSSLAGSASGANASLVTTQANCCSITWRGGSQLWFKATASGQTMTVPLTVPDSGTWQLGADMTVSYNYAQVKVDLDAGTSSAANLGGTSATPFDGYSSVVSTKYLDLGTRTLTAGQHTLTFTITGENASSTGYYMGLNFLTLSPTNRYEADTLPGPNSSTAGTLAQQCFAMAGWADNCQLMLANTTQGASFSVTFNAPVESDYALGVNLTTADDYGTDEFTLDPSTSDVVLDNTASAPVDAYSATVGAKYVFLGGVHLTAGSHTLQVTVTGTNGSSVNNRYNAGINYIEAVPVTGATDASFTAAMNNQGITTDGSTLTTGNFDLTSNSGNNLSLTAMTNAGITPGTGTAAGASFTMDGAQFTMPELHTSNGTVTADNVIPDGQNIPLPAEDASAVALLMTSTCGAAPAAYATLSYGGTSVQPSQAQIPSVPDWVSGTPADAGVRFAYFDTGTTTNTTGQPRLYEVILPANPNAPLASITLPTMPVNLLTDSGGCAASASTDHIFAIGVRPASASTGNGNVWTGAYDGPMDEVFTSSTMSNETLREAIPVTADGNGYVRLHLSNAFSPAPVTFDDVTVAAQSTSGAMVTLAPPSQVKFGGDASVTIPAGGDAYSDPAAMPPTSGGTGWLLVSMHIPATETVTALPVHESVDSLTTYNASGDVTANSDGTPFSSTNSAWGTDYLAGIDVSDPTTTDGTIAVLGDQTATASPATYSDNTWVRDLPSAFSSAGVPVPGSIVDASTDDAMPDHWWRMNGPGLDTSTTAYDSGSNGSLSLTLTGSPTWSTSHPAGSVTAGSLVLNGTSQAGATSGPAVTATSSFAVSAWVKLASLPTGNAAVVAQNGSTASGFVLGYQASSGDWGFWFNSADSASPTVTGVYDTAAAATAGTWTQLTGVYNASAGQIKLYVNGKLAASASYTPAWSPGGALTVGQALASGSAADWLPGSVSDVRAYNRVMWDYAASEIYNDTGVSSVTAANGAAAFGTSAFEQAAAEPGLRDVIVSLGANDVLQGEPASGVESSVEASLGAMVAYFTGIYAPSEPNTGLNVFITTIPPLGLSSSDPREAVRAAVNTWLTNNGAGTADGVIDIASAVADSANPNQISSAYLSGGVPTSAYYTAIATEVATVLAGPPPLSL